jgi:lipopolysaccharide/colanic/teichoic acid biosynthesis glycosyltransferase
MESIDTGDLPPSDWLIHLHLKCSRRGIRCLGWRRRLTKRAVDIVGATILLAALWPVMLLVAALVRLTSRGPALYRQIRVGLNLRQDGRDRRRSDRPGPAAPSVKRRSGFDRRGDPSCGRPFVLYKFRTMSCDAEAAGPRFASAGDSRVTPLGRFLRRYRLDELPQLWNVLRGEMSLVGPRPERPEFMAELSAAIPGYLDRLGLKPGLTGLAQVVNGYDNEPAGFRRKLALDLLYLQNCCFRNDAKILLRTVGVVLTGRGAL